MRAFFPMSSLTFFLLFTASACQSGEEEGKRPAAQVLVDFDALPQCLTTGGPGETATRENLALARQRAALIVEIRKDHPDHVRTAELTRERWTLMTALPLAFAGWDGPIGGELWRAMTDEPGSPAAKAMIERVQAAHSQVEKIVLRECEAVIAAAPRSAVAKQAYYPRARLLTGLVMNGDRSEVAAALAAVEGLLKFGAEADRSGFMPSRLLLWIADSGYERTDDPERVRVLRSILKRFPDSSEARSIPGKLAQIEALGKPFPLRFTDAISGQDVDLVSMKGKVVVLDFWATWCVPCKAGIPHLVEIYNKHRDEGLEIIGVSLDQSEEHGGLEKLRHYVAQEKLPWPQYYLGGADTPFTQTWGISSIPQLFVIDTDGNLYSTDARDRLDEVVEKLLAGR